MNILRPRVDLPGTSREQRNRRGSQRVGVLMIFIYAFLALLLTAFGAAFNGCRLENTSISE